MGLTEAPDQSQIDGDEPHLAGGSVEDAPQTGFLARHAGQLSVGRVVEVGPHQQQNACNVIPETADALCTIGAVGEAES